MELNTAEKFLVLAHHPEKPRFVVQEARMRFGLTGALLLELSLKEKIEINDNCVILKRRESDPNPILNEFISMIKESDKNHKIRFWVRRLSRKSLKYKWMIISDLEKKRIMRIEHKKFLGIFPYRLCHLVESRTRNQLIRDLNKSVKQKEIENENLVMLGMIEACNMHKVISADREEAKRIKKTLKVIIKENPIASTVAKTIREVQAAVAGAVIASGTAGAH